MLDVELAASKLNLHSSSEIKLITITGGGGRNVPEAFKRNNKHTIQLSIKKHTSTSSLPGLYLSSCKADKKGHCYLTEQAA